MTSALRGMWHHLAQQPESYERKQYYTFGKVLGAGTFGEVREAVFEPTGQHVAIKVIKKSSLNGNEEMVVKEINLVRGLHHPHIVKLLDWFESKDKYYLVFQLCTGGELFQKIMEFGKFTEKDAIGFLRCGFESIAYLHKHNIVHRDIKPENFIFADKTPDAPLMLADFGIARIMKDNDEVLSTMCGSMGYVAPEVLLRKGHGKAVDIWSMGIVTFSTLCGYSPFWKFEEPRALIVAMQSDNIEFDDRYWWNVSSQAKDFIRGCLRSDPKDRMTIEEALVHPWMTGEHDDTHDLLPDVKENFNARATLRRAVLKVQALNRMRRASQGKSMSSSSGASSNSLSSDGQPLSPPADDSASKGNGDEDTIMADNKSSPQLPGGWNA